MRPLAVVSAIGFILFFIGIVVIADRGDGARWWAFIDRIPYGDKVGHLVLVSILSLLCNLAFTRWESARGMAFITRTTWILFVVLTLEELSQGFSPHRHLDVFDWLADIAGLALGQSLARVICLKSRETKEP